VPARRAADVRSNLLLVWLVAVGVLSSPGSALAAASTDEVLATQVRAVVANVGNVSPHCAEQAFSLCLLPLEERIAPRLAELDPDVIALIEVLPPDLCDGVTPQNPSNSCSLPTQDPPQALRLLAHDTYDVVCGDRHAWDCLAVRASIGAIEGCPGGYCGPVAPSLPVDEGCDDGFESFLVDVTLHDVPLTVAVTHPDSTDETCRADQVADLFAAVEATDREALVLGDFNLDPFREQDASVDIWDAHVGDDRPLRLLSGPVEHEPPYFTLLPFESAQLDPTGSLPVNVELRDLALARTIDHVVATTGLSGACTTLGEAPGTERLEGPEGGLDHRALDCEVTVATEATVPPDEAGGRRPEPSASPEPPPASAAPARPTPAAAGDPLPATGGGVAAAGALLVAGAFASRGAVRRR
jgi:hypothetical protein